MKLKGNQDMIRIIAIAAAFLVMFVIIGIAMYSINNIDEINQKKREKEDGKNFAATVVQTTATTNVWEYLRASEEAVQTTAAIEFVDETLQPQDESVNEMPDTSEQTITATVPTAAQ